MICIKSNSNSEKGGGVGEHKQTDTRCSGTFLALQIRKNCEETREGLCQSCPSLLHWLHIHSSIQYRLSVKCFNFFAATCHDYFFLPDIPARQLRSLSFISHQLLI